MPPSSIITAAGLYTAPNALSARPAGALSQARNVIIRQRGVIEPRPARGGLVAFDDSAYLAPGEVSQLTSIAPFGSYLIGHSQNSEKLGHSNGLVQFSFYSGTYATPNETTNYRLKSTTAQENFYFLTSTGVRCLEAYNSTPRTSGIPRALDLDVRESTTSSGGSGTWFPDKSKVAYVAVWGRKDTHGTVRLGPPSGRTVFANTSGAVGGTQNILIPQPAWASDEYFYRIYRSECSPTAPSNTTLIEPPEDVYLIYENSGLDTLTIPIGSAAKAGSAVVTVTSAAHNYRTGMYVTVTAGGGTFAAGTFEITVTGANTFTYNDGASDTATNSAEFTVTPKLLPALISDNTTGTNEDIVPESLLGDPLYTNSDQEGALEANFPPPLCRDITYWNDRAWFANTELKQRLSIRLLGVDSAGGVSTGIANNETITIAGQTYTAKTTPSASVVTEFLVSAAGTPALQVEASAKALVNAINANSSNTTVYAWYQSGENDAPGDILIEARELGASAFTVYASNPYAWSPFLTTSSTGAVSSENDAATNRLYYSKLEQAETAPLLNYVDIGPKNSTIERIIPLRDKLYVFSTVGIYTVSGQAPFRVDEFDTSVRLAHNAWDTPAVVNNKIFCLSTLGVGAISDAGVQIISGPVSDCFLNNGYPEGKYPFGVGQDAEGLYHLFITVDSVPTDVDVSENANEASHLAANRSSLVFDVRNGTWVLWTGLTTCGTIWRFLNRDRLILGGCQGKVFGAPEATSYGYTLMQSVAENTTTAALTGHADHSNASRSIASWNATTSTLVVSSTTGYRAGDYINRGAAWGKILTVVNGTNLTMEEVSGTFTAGMFTWYQGVNYVVEWAPFHGGAPSYIKHVRDVCLHFSDQRFYSADLTSETEASSGATSSVFFSDRAYADLVGFTTQSPPRVGLVDKRLLVPATCQRCVYLANTFSLSYPFGWWALNGISYEFDITSERSTR